MKLIYNQSNKYIQANSLTKTVLGQNRWQKSWANICRQFSKSLLTLCIFCLSVVSMAQTPVPPEAEFPYRRDIEKGKFEKAAEKIFRHISRDNNSLEGHYAAYQIFAHPGYSGHSTDSAYAHLMRVRTLWSHAEQKYIERWERDSYSGALIDYGIRAVCQQALHEADSVRTPDAYQHYLAFFDQAPDDLKDAAIARRDTLEYVIATNAASMEMIQAFIVRRPSSLLVGKAIHQRDSMAFDQADRQHTTAAYDLFRTAYPRSEFYGRATDSVYTLDYRDVRLHDAEQYYRSYALRYPQSPFAEKSVWLADSIEYYRQTDSARWESFIQYVDKTNSKAWRETALHTLCQYALRHNDIRAAEQTANRMSKGNDDYARLGYFLHHAYINTSIRNFGRFYSKFPNIMSVAQRQHDSVALEMNNNYHFHISDQCIQAIAPSREAYIMLQGLIKDDIDHGRYAQALAAVEQYESVFGDDADYWGLRNTLSTASAKGERPSALPAGINQAKGDEFSPVISADERILYFAGKQRTDNIGGTDIFVARRGSKGWESAKLEMDLSHTYGHESPKSISPDGNMLLTNQSGQLYLSTRTAEGWATAKLPASLNAKVYYGNATLAANGRALIFAAWSRTDHELDSSMNLYVSLMSADGDWMDPIELGNTINTPFDECSPFLHADMRTLYFSSEGHGSLGQYDIFMTQRLDDTWRHWSAPVNIGREFNTSGDDLGVNVAPNGGRFYVERQGTTKDIYQGTLPMAARPESVTVLSGTVKDRDGKPVSTAIYYEDPTTGEILGYCQTDPARGTYRMLLPQGRVYGVFVASPQYFPSSTIIDLAYEKDGSQLAHDFLLTTYDQMTDDDMRVILNNVSFEVAYPNFTPASKAELHRLAHIIKEGNYQVEVACHLDGNVGDKENLALTQLRANAIRDYLIELGCRPSDISARGYGSDRPLILSSSVSSKTARPQSRRVEIELKK